MHGNIMDRTQWHKVLEPIEEEIRSKFKFKRIFLGEAERRIQAAKLKYLEKYRAKKKKKKKKDPELVFIGVHVR